MHVRSWASEDELTAVSLSPQNSLPAGMSIGVPIKVLHEAEGHIVTCETNTGEVYRGKLIEAEDNMNCQVPCSARGRGGPEPRRAGRGRLGFLEVLAQRWFTECLSRARPC